MCVCVVMWLISLLLLLLLCVCLSVCQGYTGVVGLLGSLLSIGVMASPLAVVQTVLRDRSTAALPFSTRCEASGVRHGRLSRCCKAATAVTHL